MSIKYRRDIDGLRAISVFAVVFYHADFIFFNKEIFSGGFIGVDIFFVISGYLITSLILKEIYNNVVNCVCGDDLCFNTKKPCICDNLIHCDDKYCLCCRSCYCGNQKRVIELASNWANNIIEDY